MLGLALSQLVWTYLKAVEPALGYLVDVGYLTRTGEEAFRITVEGINEVQRRPQL